MKNVSKTVFVLALAVVGFAHAGGTQVDSAATQYLNCTLEGIDNSNKEFEISQSVAIDETKTVALNLAGAGYEVQVEKVPSNFLNLSASVKHLKSGVSTNSSAKSQILMLNLETSDAGASLVCNIGASSK